MTEYAWDGTVAVNPADEARVTAALEKLPGHTRILARRIVPEGVYYLMRDTALEFEWPDEAWSFRDMVRTDTGHHMTIPPIVIDRDRRFTATVA